VFFTESVIREQGVVSISGGLLGRKQAKAEEHSSDKGTIISARRVTPAIF